MSNPTIITVAIIKGGSGKTTTSMEIAGALARRGEHVTVLDADNTGGATLWEEYVLQSGDQLNFEVVPANMATLNNVERIRAKYDGYVIIDTPPSDVGIMQAAIDCADVTVIPCQPSISDLTHAGKTFMACKDGIVLMTRVKPRTKLARNAIAELDQQEIPRFETVITEREAIKNMYGTTTVDKVEYSSVVQELLDYLAQKEQ